MLKAHYLTVKLPELINIISPNNIHTSFSKQVMRILKPIRLCCYLDLTLNFPDNLQGDV